VVDEALKRLGPPVRSYNHNFQGIEKDFWFYHVKGTDINMQLQFWNGQVCALFNDMLIDTGDQPLRTFAEVKTALTPK
jgi:hypothetical protein